MPANGYGTYRRIGTETSSPSQLVLRLYEALLVDLHRAEQALADSGDHEHAHASLVHAQEILIELVASLDMNAGEIAEQLGGLYQYMYRRLVQANVRKDTAAVTEVTALLRPIHAAWQQVVRSAPSGLAPATTRAIKA